MISRSILLIGPPDSGKTNYIGRLWASLKERKGQLQPIGMPSDIKYVNSTVEHLMKGRFSPRSDRNLEDSREEFSVKVQSTKNGLITELVMPDISGELWKNAVRDAELPSEWIDELAAAYGAILFVRVHSELNTQPADWVTARNWLQTNGTPNNSMEIPTQVILCELLRFVECFLADPADGSKPRVALVVSAWDRLDNERKAAGPIAYLEREFPLLAGRLTDPGRLDIKVFGLSILGGDLEDDAEFRERIRGREIADMGSVSVIENGISSEINDITLPVAWVIGE